ncbi:MAG: YceI family protein [Candidatus Latescibacterota bacterium]|nr:YceI family protein [Candidatus Latescibacterota bacterium]
MSHRFQLCLVFTFLFSICNVGAVVYKIDSEHSNVSFSIRYLVSNTGGNFHAFSGEIVYDVENPEKIQIRATIQANSIDTDNVKRDGHLRSDDFLNVEKYPIITFRSSKAELVEDAVSVGGLKEDILRVEGEFTMHGVSKIIKLPVRFLGKGVHPYKQKQVIGFSADTVIQRSDYGVNNWPDKAGVLSDAVDVQLTIQAVQTSE